MTVQLGFTKVCVACKTEKQCSEFWRDKRTPDGFDYRCKDCKRKSRGERAGSASVSTEPKKCSRCGVVQDRQNFGRKRNTLDGLDYYCKTCCAIRHVERQKRINPEFMPRRKGRDPDKECAANRRHYVRHQAKRKQYREENREYYRNYIATYNKTIKAKQAWRTWKRNNPHAVRMAARRRHARERGAGGTFTTAEWKALCDRYGNVCLACGESKPLTIDHVVPIAKGGKNTIDNIQPLCLSCNSSKGAKHIDYRPPDPDATDRGVDN